MAQLKRVTPKPLYDTDFAAWIEQQVTLLRASKLHALDLKNIADRLKIRM